MWIVHSPCDCDDEGCYGKADLKLFESEQTAKQEAEQRSKRYGGWSGRPDMHMDQIDVSTKTTGY